MTWGDDELAKKEVTDKIMDYLGTDPVFQDAPRREGDLCFRETHKKWKQLTRGGRHRLTQAEHKRDNAIVGSSFNEPILYTPCVKENNGVMHTSAGHTNHYWMSISNSIRSKMKGSGWHLRLETIDDEVDNRINVNQQKKKSCEASNSRKVSQILCAML